ncbi:hypothetical protein Sste5346_003927 [Sporothrix stenoceras]|uniref:Xylanolytic transcriptional activator regulatory domain-containing protein n=1 Tax=Sporothrix stenoceras TaxID=5173 RepID=A0ABR3ZAE5_9PEZI
MLDALVTLVEQPEEEGTAQNIQYCTDMAMFYLVMALGATNYANTLKQLQQLQQNHNDAPPAELSKPPSPPHLYYAQALHYFNRVVQNEDRMETSVAVIQIVLLISIYSSYGQGPIGSSQWQLAGLAMRMAMEIGLHHEPRQPVAPSPEYENVRDQRRRVFWTAYVIDISLAYNLGRPPSIGEEHITVRLPHMTKDSALGIHHVRHRQIQSRIVSHVYAGGRVAMSGTADATQTITRIQGELEAWRGELPSVLQSAGDDMEGSDSTSSLLSYPPHYWERLYHGTSFVLHRASPLSPQPSPASLEQCVRAAGAYLDCMLEVVRHSHVPLSWMLVQGVLFAGLSMLITARTRFQTLSQHAPETVRLLLVELPMWTRRCSICLAVMNERWSLNRSRNRSEEDLLSQLEKQFEALAGDTLSLITASVLGSSTGATKSSSTKTAMTTMLPPAQASPTYVFAPAETDLASSDAQLQQDILQNTDPTLMGTNDWDHLQDFREFLGIDGAYTFWDIFPTTDSDFTINESGQGDIPRFPPW